MGNSDEFDPGDGGVPCREEWTTWSCAPGIRPDLLQPPGVGQNESLPLSTL